MGAIQVRDVPDELHEALRRRAESEGMTMREYLLRVIERDLSLPTPREWLARTAELEPVEGLDVVEAIHAGRAEREERLLRTHRH
jgi:antitoxin FitA